MPRRSPLLICDPFRRWLVLVGIFALVGSVGGCEEKFSDKQLGVLDLAPYYDEINDEERGAGVPEAVPISRGYVNGSIAEYYDFGLVPAEVDPTSGEPVAVRVQPMYFFFNAAEQPLFSHPVRERRDGIDKMLGGKDILNPNPKDYCVEGADPAACEAENAKQRERSYPQRIRDPLIDRNRGVDDYQRPIVDLVPGDAGGVNTEYTGLWEIVEVITPGDYEPDAIKQLSTLNDAIESGDFRKRATGKVINCPIIDERMQMQRGITSRGVFRPIIELWYRRLLAFCFLADGWETLGTADGQPFFANSDGDRRETFDVSRLTLGQGGAAQQALVVPVSRAYEPAITVSQGAMPAVTQVAGNIITAFLPRRNAGDPGGYSPIRWMFDVAAPSDYQRGSWDSLDDVNPVLARPRGGFFSPEVRNISLRGLATPCSFPRDPSLRQCGNRVQDPTKPQGNFIIDPKGDPTCNAQRDPFNPDEPPLECNRDTCFCDAPFVGYGEVCGPGIAQCKTDQDSFAEHGYQCFPPWASRGFCQLACEGTNKSMAMNEGKEPIDWVDSRCGDVTGYLCLIGTCIKLCDQNISDDAQCAVNRTVGEEMRNIQNGQTCTDFGLFVCSWPDTWEPVPFPIP